MERTCDYCGESLAMRRADARFCNAHCRVYWSRAQKRPALPSEMTLRRTWVRRTADKRPVTASGRAASSMDSRTWTDYATASKSTVGAGLGFVLDGSGVGCIDLDHAIEDGVIADWAQSILDANPATFAEVSQSGSGIHVWGLLDASPGRKIRDGRDIEIYSTGRYIALGSPIPSRPMKLEPLNLP